jgi:hypothetical protein
VRRAATDGASVLVIEAVSGDDRRDPVVRTLDMIMLAITGGRERTSVELGRLLSGAGLEIVATHATQGPLRIVEAVA